MLYVLVLILDILQNEFLVMGPHCPNRDFGRIKLLTPAHISSELTSFYALTREDSKATGKNRSVEEREIPVTVSSGDGTEDADSSAIPVGLLVADRAGHEFKVIEDPIPPDLVDLLVGRLMHKTIVQKTSGSNSYFIK